MRPKFLNPNHPRRTSHEHGLKPPDIFRPTRSVRHAASHPLSRPPTGGCQTGETINGDAGAEGMRPDARLEIPIPFPVRAFISNGMSWRTCLPDRFCRFNKTVDYGESHKRHQFRTRGRAKVGVRRWGKADGSRRKPTGPSAARRSPVERQLPMDMCVRRRPTPAPSGRTHEGPRRARTPAAPTRASPSSSPTIPPWLQRPSSRSRARAIPRRRRF